MKQVSERILIHAPVEVAYKNYTDYHHLAEKMDELENVEVEGSAKNRMHWKVQAESGLKLEWQARVTRQIPNELIEWDEVDDSKIKTKGNVKFHRVDENSCEVSVECHYTAPGGDMVASIGELLADPQELLRDNLEEFKKYCEAQCELDRKHNNLNRERQNVGV